MADAFAPMTRFTLLAVLSIAVAVGLVGRQLPGTDAAFTDRVTSSGNSVGAGNLQPPTLAASVSGTTVNLSWTNPDGLTGAPSTFVVQRASGPCTSPGTFSAISGSPFAITTLSTTDSPGAGTWCYVVQAKFHNWLSPFGTASSVNQKSVTVSHTPVETLTLTASTSTGTCGTQQLNGSTLSGSTVLATSGTTSATWVLNAGSATELRAGTYSFTLQRNPHGGAGANATMAAVTFSVEIGVCDGGVFVAKGSATGSFPALSSPATQTTSVSVTVSGPTTLDIDTLAAVVVTNTTSTSGNQQQRRIAVDTAGGSFATYVGP